ARKRIECQRLRGVKWLTAVVPVQRAEGPVVDDARQQSIRFGKSRQLVVQRETHDVREAVAVHAALPAVRVERILREGGGAAGAAGAEDVRHVVDFTAPGIRGRPRDAVEVRRSEVRLQAVVAGPAAVRHQGLVAEVAVWPAVAQRHGSLQSVVPSEYVGKASATGCRY